MLKKMGVTKIKKFSKSTSSQQESQLKEDNQSITSKNSSNSRGGYLEIEEKEKVE